jgi:hypothetical protein
MIRVETITPKPATSNGIENVRRSVRSTRESYNAYQRDLMARRRASAKADQVALAEAK